MKRQPAFLFSVTAWAIAFGLYMLVRFFGTLDKAAWLSSGVAAGFVIWAILSLIFGSAYRVFLKVIDGAYYRSRPYGFFIGAQVLFLLIATLAAHLIVRIAEVMQGNLSWADFPGAYVSGLFTRVSMAFTLFMLVAGSVITFIRQMVVKVGPWVMGNLLLGRYYQPREENRIFLFIDLQSSTRIAARLGHRRYGKLIQDCFLDLTESVLTYDVEVYQYIGDEAVLTWKPGEGVRNSNCIRAYYHYIDTLQRRRQYYLSQYGLVPFFKAGGNAGPVTVAEIGIVKREIAYLGEVLHTAARLQSFCNKLKKGILISESLRQRLANDPALRIEQMGDLKLKGKSAPEPVYFVSVDDLPSYPYPRPFA